MTYAQAVEWAIENTLPFADDFDEWIDLTKKEITTPDLFESQKFMAMFQRAWENEVGDINKSKAEIEEGVITMRQEAREQTAITEFESQKFEVTIRPIKIRGLPQFREQPALPREQPFATRTERPIRPVFEERELPEFISQPEPEPVVEKPRQQAQPKQQSRLRRFFRRIFRL